MATKILLCSSLVLALLMPGLAATQQPVIDNIVAIDRIVAVVNEDVITRRELDDAIKTAAQQLQRQGTPLPSSEILEKQLLERIIVDRAQLQLARETGLTVSDAQLEQTIRRIAQENGMSLEEFRAALERDKVSLSKFRNDIRQEITLARLREREVDSRVNVTEAEIDNFLRTQETASSKTEEYRLAHIYVRVAEEADAEQTQARLKRAEKALAQLKSGVEFTKVAAAFSDASDAQEGAVLDWRPVTRMATAFTEALSTMQPGELTPVIRSVNGFHILKLLDRRGREAALVANQTHARHILVKFGELVSEADIKRRIAQIKERIDSGGNFQELAKQYSEDGSASSGGDLGWLSAGDTVPEFERAMNELKPGQVSAPTRSTFGWHLIQVVERRAQDISNERRRQLARQAVHARKAEETSQDWLRQVRDRAYVEYRLEER